MFLQQSHNQTIFVLICLCPLNKVKNALKSFLKKIQTKIFKAQISGILRMETKWKILHSERADKSTVCLCALHIPPPKKDQYSLEIESSRGHLWSWLIGYWPHDHRGMVLVPTYKLVHNIQVMVQGGATKTASTSTQHTRSSRLFQVTDSQTAQEQRELFCLDQQVVSNFLSLNYSKECFACVLIPLNSSHWALKNSFTFFQGFIKSTLTYYCLYRL